MERRENHVRTQVSALQPEIPKCQCTGGSREYAAKYENEITWLGTAILGVIFARFKIACIYRIYYERYLHIIYLHEFIELHT